MRAAAPFLFAFAAGLAAAHPLQGVLAPILEKNADRLSLLGLRRDLLVAERRMLDAGEGFGLSTRSVFAAGGAGRDGREEVFGASWDGKRASLSLDVHPEADSAPALRMGAAYRVLDGKEGLRDRYGRRIALVERMAELEAEAAVLEDLRGLLQSQIDRNAAAEKERVVERYAGLRDSLETLVRRHAAFGHISRLEADQSLAFLENLDMTLLRIRMERTLHAERLAWIPWADTAALAAVPIDSLLEAAEAGLDSGSSWPPPYGRALDSLDLLLRGLEAESAMLRGWTLRVGMEVGLAGQDSDGARDVVAFARLAAPLSPPRPKPRRPSGYREPPGPSAAVEGFPALVARSEEQRARLRGNIAGYLRIARLEDVRSVQGAADGLFRSLDTELALIEDAAAIARMRLARVRRLEQLGLRLPRGAGVGG